MSLFRLVPAAVAAAWLGGCAIHPVQQQVTGQRTVEIVKRIRCETRVAIIEKARQLLVRYNNAPAADLLMSQRTFDARGLKRLLTPEQNIFYEKYSRTAIAYDFTFDIEEQNVVAGTVDPIGVISRGTLSAAAGAGGTFQRNNLRNFLFAESFYELLNDVDLRDCRDMTFLENFAYPISGRIGMFEVLDTFVDLNVATELDSKGPGVPVFADTLRFTTTIAANAGSTVALSPLVTNVNLGGSLTASARRIDEHKVILGLSFPATPKVATRRKSRLMSLRSGALPAPFGVTISGAIPKSLQEEKAIDAVATQRLNTFYDRLGRSIR